jgi:hypothetical protein
LEDQVDDWPVDEDELEPSLGSVASTGDQSKWSAGGHNDLEDEHNGQEPDFDGEPSLCGITACEPGDDSNLEGDDSDREPTLGWTVDGCVTATNYENCDRELAAEPKVTGADRKAYNKATFGMNPVKPNDGKHVDVDGTRIGPRKVCNLSRKQEKLLTPRIDRRKVRL